MNQNVPTPHTFKPLDPGKFKNPLTTAKGERRAEVALKRLETLWFNTGTLCNIACKNCYIESSPTNDRLVYLTAAEIAAYLDEAEALGQRLNAFAAQSRERNARPRILDFDRPSLMRGYFLSATPNRLSNISLHHR